jgi:purine nucleosidase
MKQVVANSILYFDLVVLLQGNHFDLELMGRNACLILQMAGRTDIPVFLGANKPLTTAYFGHSGIKVHAENAIGGIEHPIEQLNTAALDSNRDVSAAQALVNLVNKNPGEITIVAIGPLTNIALAVAMGGKKFIDNVKRVSIMGGSIQGLGNKTPAAEANICNDPHAAKIVFDAFPDILMAGLNCTQQIVITAEFRNELRQLNAVGQFCFDITEHYVNILKEWSVYIHISKYCPCFIHVMNLFNY